MARHCCSHTSACPHSQPTSHPKSPGVKHRSKHRGWQQEDGQPQHQDVGTGAECHACSGRPRRVWWQLRRWLWPRRLRARPAGRSGGRAHAASPAALVHALRRPPSWAAGCDPCWQGRGAACCSFGRAGLAVHSHCCGAAPLLLSAAAAEASLLLPPPLRAASATQLSTARSTAAAARARTSACHRWLSCAGPGWATSRTVAARCSRCLQGGERRRAAAAASGGMGE